MRAVQILLIAALFLGAVASPAWAEPSPNDDFDAAIEVPEIPFSHVVLTNEATKATDDPDCSSGSRTVWYRFSPAEDIRVDATTIGSNYDTTLGVYTGARGELAEVGCNDDAFGTTQSYLRFEASAGETYHLMIGSLATGTRGTLKLNLRQAPSPPENDVRARAETIERLPFSTSLDVSAATVSPDDPGCQAAGNTVWYSFTAGKARKLRASTGRSTFDAVLGIYQVDGDGLKEAVCTANSLVEFEPEAGGRYLFMIGSESGWGGTLRFTLDFAPTPLKAAVTVTPEGRVSRVTGEARVHGTVTCSTDSSVYLSGVIKQRRKQRVVSDDFGIRIDCKPVPKAKIHTFTLRLSGGAWAFHRGLASLELAMKASNSDDEVTRRSRRQVSLKPCSCP